MSFKISTKSSLKNDYADFFYIFAIINIKSFKQLLFLYVDYILCYNKKFLLLLLLL